MTKDKTEDTAGDDLEQAARLALDAWDLDAKDLELVSKSENLVYRLTTTAGEQYALRIHRPGYHELPELESENQWAAALAAAGVPESVGLLNRDGRYYTTVPFPDVVGHRHVDLLEWLEGELLWPSIEAEPDEQARLSRGLACYREIGSVSARIHNQAEAWQAPREFVRERWDADGLMGADPLWGRFWDLPQLTGEQRGLLLAARDAIHELLLDLGESPSRFSLIHADLHGYNLMLTPTGVRVLDFDDAGFGWHLYELAVALYGLADMPDLYQPYRDAVVEGYRAHRRLSDEDLALLPVFILIRSMVLLGWLHQRMDLPGAPDRIGAMIESCCQRIRTTRIDA